MGRSLAALERWHELGVEMVRLLAEAPDLTEAWLLDGEALLGQRLFDEAESALRRALVARGPEAQRARALIDEIAVVRRAGVPQGGDELYDGTEERTEIDPPGAGGRLAALIASAAVVDEDYDDEATRERPVPPADQKGKPQSGPPSSELGLYAEAEPPPSFAGESPSTRSRKPTPAGKRRPSGTPISSPSIAAVPGAASSSSTTPVRPDPISPFAPRAQDSSPAPMPRAQPLFGALPTRALIIVAAVLGVVLLVLVQWVRKSRQHAAEETAITRLLEAGNYDDFRQAAAAAERMGELPRAARIFGRMAWELGVDPAPAEALLARAGDGNDSGDDRRLARAWIALCHGNLHAADAQVSGASDAESFAVAGWSALVAANLNAARAAFDQLLAQKKHDPLAEHALGVVEWQAKEFTRADAAFGRALAANANQLSSMIDRARLVIAVGDEAGRRQARETLGGVLQRLGAHCSPGQLARAELGLAQLALREGDPHGEQLALDQARKLASPTDVLVARAIAELAATPAANAPTNPAPTNPALTNPTPTPAPAVAPVAEQPLSLITVDALLAAGKRAEAEKAVDALPRTAALALVLRGLLLLPGHGAAAENLGLNATNRRGASAAERQSAWLLVARARLSQGDRKQSRRAYESAVAVDAASELGQLATTELTQLGSPVKRSSAGAKTGRRGR